MLITVDKLAETRDRHSDKTIVLTSGIFNLFHTWHLSYLEQVKSHGEIVVVMLNGDKRVKARKGDKRPIIDEVSRARILDGLKAVDYVFIDPSDINPDATDPVHAEILHKLKPDFYVIDGPDPRFYTLLNTSQFIIVERMDTDPSTTSIIKRIIELGYSGY